MKIILFVTLFYCSAVFAQVGIGTTSPDAALDITSTTEGLLIPRIALVNTTTATLPSPTISEMVYNTATAGDVVPGYYFWNGTIWEKLVSGMLPNSGWSLTGNTGTTVTTNFIGTTDDVDLIFKRNNIKSGLIGTTNTAFGNNSLPIATGNFNTAIGHRSLYSNTTGESNVAIGSYALNDNTSGYDNTAIGVSALIRNTTGSANIAIGSQSLDYNSTGIGNIAIGFNTLHASTISNYNVAIGFEALYANYFGENNVATGFYSLRNNQLGSNNVATGYQSLSNNYSGSNNTANGSNALYSNTTGKWKYSQWCSVIIFEYDRL